METGEDVLASEESAQGGVSNQEGGVFHVNVAGGRDLRSSRNKKLTRKVSFPDDSQLVRALDPVDPWEHGKYLSVSGFVFLKYGNRDGHHIKASIFVIFQAYKWFCLE